MSARIRLFAGAASIALLASTQAMASADDYIAKFCAGGACINPTAERMQMRPTWDALTATGTSAFVGGSIDNVRLDPATLIAGARVIGVPALDGLLRSGQVPFSGADARRLTLARMATVQGVDVNSAVGLPSTASAAPISGQRDAAGALGGLAAVIAGISTGSDSAIPNVNSTNGCDANIERMQISSAANYVQDRSAIASSQAGFTRKDGQGAMSSLTQEIGNGGRPMSSGFTGMNCLGNLFNFSNLDILFKPPLMNNMMSQLAGMRCQPALSGASGIGAQLQSQMFQTLGMGGFLPGMNLSQYAGGMNGAAQGNFTGVANLAMTLAGSSGGAPTANTQTIGSLYGSYGR
jgi:hypothetical protein